MNRGTDGQIDWIMQRAELNGSCRRHPWAQRTPRTPTHTRMCGCQKDEMLENFNTYIYVDPRWGREGHDWSRLAASR